MNYFYKKLLFCACMFFAIANNCHARSVIMMFGDSITQGSPYISSPANGGNYGPSLSELQQLLNDSDRPSLVLNWGVGGSNSAQGVNRIDSNIDNSKGHSADQYFIVLHYGTNDDGYGMSISDTSFNTKILIDKARAKGVTPLLGALIPRSDDDVTPRNSALASVASNRSVPYINHYQAFGGTNNSSYFQSLMLFETHQDGTSSYLHPNSSGYNLIANTWFNNGLSNLITPEPPAPPPEPPTPIITPIISLLLLDD